MQKLSATLIDEVKDMYITNTKPINIMGIEFHGWKALPFKKIAPSKNDSPSTKYKLVVDTEATPIYDELTQVLIDRDELQKMLAQSTASNAKANVDVENLKKQNAELTQQIAKMQIQNKKG